MISEIKSCLYCGGKLTNNYCTATGHVFSCGYSIRLNVSGVEMFYSLKNELIYWTIINHHWEKIKTITLPLNKAIDKFSKSNVNKFLLLI